MLVPFDIQNLICYYLYDLKDAINMYNLSKSHQDNIIIKNLCHIPDTYLRKLTQKIIEQKKFHRVEKLYAWDNKEITSVDHMYKSPIFGVTDSLKILACGNRCGINQDGISQVNLTILNAHNNKKITNVNHMKNTLKILVCSGECGIGQEGISQLSLIQLELADNKKIINVNHMKNTLRFLDCSFQCALEIDGFSELKLSTLVAHFNKKVIRSNLVKNIAEKFYYTLKKD